MKRNHKIIAVDFDGTLCENIYPNIGEANTKLISSLKRAKKKGCKLILWTCRCDEYLWNAVKWCDEKGLIFDAINDNIPEMITKFGENPRKVYADIYLDDRNATEEYITSIF